MSGNQEKNIDYLNDLWKRIPLNIWICLCSGLITGLITHMYMLMHKLPNWDEINNFRGSGSGLLGKMVLKICKTIVRGMERSK